MIRYTIKYVLLVFMLVGFATACSNDDEAMMVMMKALQCLHRLPPPPTAGVVGF